MKHTVLYSVPVVVTYDDETDTVERVVVLDDSVEPDEPDDAMVAAWIVQAVNSAEWPAWQFGY